MNVITLVISSVDIGLVISVGVLRKNHMVHDVVHARVERDLILRRVEWNLTRMTMSFLMTNMEDLLVRTHCHVMKVLRPWVHTQESCDRCYML